MAPTKRKRRRKHRGTQGGRVDTRPKGRPRNRAEARQRAKAGRSGSSARGVSQQRGQMPPTWGSAARKGLFAGLIFFVLLFVAFGREVGPSAALAGFMLAFYIPMAYYTDRFFYNRARRKEAEERAKPQGD
jgi:hypothetical protein